MPIYEYIAEKESGGCQACKSGFEIMQKVADAPLKACPECGATVRKLISAPAVGSSKSGLDDRAKNAGFHKLERRGKGEYEKKY